MQDKERLFMRRCISLAHKGLGVTYPNPLVGSVIVHNDRIIGEGWHQKAGKAHAEINAINSVEDKELLRESTLFVNLEPCSHFGKTPPCSHKIVEMGIPRVVVGCRDYAEHVNGKGINYLRSHGVEVVENIEEQASYMLNRRFFCYHKNKRPYIILKWAQTQNQFFAPEKPQQKWITNAMSKQKVHKWRSEEMAILIGANTLKIDNPQLNVRLWSGVSPLKVVISKTAAFDLTSKIFEEGKVLIFNEMKSEKIGNVEYVKLDFTQNVLEEMMTELYHRKIQSVIVEGGAFTLEQFITNDLWDEARILTGNSCWESGIPSPKIKTDKCIKKLNLKDNQLEIYLNPSYDI